MTYALARLPLARLVRGRRTWMIIAGWSLLAIVSAVAVRATGQTSGASHVMRGAFARLVIPLLAYGIAGAAIGSSGMRKGIRGLVGLGARPRPAAFAAAVVAALACAVVCSLLAMIVCALAHGSADPPLGADLFASTWISGLGGAAYGAYFAAGSALGKGGGMRSVLLLFDFFAGAVSGAGALLTPRGHVVSLLGGPLVADLSQRASSVALVVLVVVYGAMAVALSRRAA